MVENDGEAIECACWINAKISQLPLGVSAMNTLASGSPILPVHCQLTNLKETDKDMIIMGDDWELVDKCVHACNDLKQNAIIGNTEAGVGLDVWTIKHTWCCHLKRGKQMCM